jgi:hypothetical protein
MDLMTTQSDRVQKNTPKSINKEVESEIWENIRFYASQRKEVISDRIDELEKEWNMDRVLLTNASSLAGIGLLLGVTVDRRWLILPGVVFAFLLQHGLQGWCPPLPLFRKLGVRSFKEIDRERFALKYLRGDFNGLPGNVSGNTDQLYHAVSK